MTPVQLLVHQDTHIHFCKAAISQPEPEFLRVGLLSLMHDWCFLPLGITSANFSRFLRTFHMSVLPSSMSASPKTWALLRNLLRVPSITIQVTNEDFG